MGEIYIFQKYNLISKENEKENEKKYSHDGRFGPRYNNHIVLLLNYEGRDVNFSKNMF